MVNSISKILQRLIDEDLSLQDALQRDYGNYSAIARMLLPKVKEILGQDVKYESIITSVRRAKANYKPLGGKITKVVAESVISIRTDIAKVSVEKTKENLEKIRKTLAGFPREFFHVIEGTSVVTVIFDQISFDEICSMFMEKDFLDKKKDLAIITIHSPVEVIDTPGLALAFYSTISRKRINIEETMSCFTDTILVLRMKDVCKAFEALADLITEGRKQSERTA